MPSNNDVQNLHRRQMVVQDALKVFQDMFESNVSGNVSCSPGRWNGSPPDENGKINTYARFTWPSGSIKDLTSPTLVLKYGIGGITIEELYKKVPGRSDSNILVAFTYRFIDLTHNVQYSYTYGQEEDLISSSPYNFRYDMDLRPEKPKDDPDYHIQVSNNRPRFEIKEKITLPDFLRVIKSTHFNDDWTSKTAPYWHNTLRAA